MKLVKSLLTNNPCYKVGKKITVKGLMLHSVGCPQPDANVFIRNWNKASYDNACVHGFIDGNTGIIYQTLPWNHRGWHCARSGNDTHIGVEVCEPSVIQYTGGASFKVLDRAKALESVKKTYEAAVELFAYLCKEYGLNPLAKGVICSHSEGYKLGIASNHADIEHLWNGLNSGFTMDGFRKDVAAAMGKVEEKPQEKEENVEIYRVRKSWVDSKSQIGAYKNIENAKNACPVGYSVFDSKGNVVYKPEDNSAYKVKITVDALNIRAGAGTNYRVNGVIRDKGIYTIVSTSGSWGKLKSGAGWICLDYTQRI